MPKPPKPGKSRPEQQIIAVCGDLRVNDARVEGVYRRLEQLPRHAIIAHRGSWGVEQIASGWCAFNNREDVAIDNPEVLIGLVNRLIAFSDDLDKTLAAKALVALARAKGVDVEVIGDIDGGAA